MAYRFRLEPTEEQTDVLVRHCADARFVWNIALEQMGYWRPGRPSVDTNAWDRQLTEARKDSWLGEGSSHIQQGALRDLRQAWRNHWRNPDHFGRPRWRRAGTHESFVVRDLTLRRLNKRWAELTVPKAGRVRFRLSRPWYELEKCTSARVICDRAGHWHASLNAPQPALVREQTGAVIGLDLGIAASVATSEGALLRMPGLLSSGQEQRRRRLERKFARQQKGSARRRATRRALARLAARETDRRKNWIEQTTTKLVRDYDLIAVEDLKVKNMLRSAKGTLAEPGLNVRQKAGLNRSIQAQSWALFRQRLEEKSTAATSLSRVVAINPRFTSQTCNACQHRAAGNRESQAVFHCLACGHQAHADTNAAQNILAAGLAVTARGGTAGKTAPMKREPPKPLLVAA